MSRWKLPFGCCLFLCLLVAQALAQPTVRLWRGEVQRKHLHERFLRLARGGDQHFYAVLGSSGHYWQFGAEGERNLKILRLDPERQLVDTLRIRSGGGVEMAHVVYEVIPSPQGLSLVTARRAAPGSLPSLELFHPDWGADPRQGRWQKLADLPGFAIGLDQPQVRVVYAPDSSHVLVTWRRLAQHGESDRSLTCLLLDRNLQVVRPPFSPFKHFQQDTRLREILLLDDAHLLFVASTLQYGNLLSGPGTVSHGLLHYDIQADDLRIIRLSGRHIVPVETRLSLGPDGQLFAAGWYMDQEGEDLETGAYIGKVTGADTLEDLHLVPFEAPMEAALIRQERRDGAVNVRPSYQSALLSGEEGHAFVLHLRGEADPGLRPVAPGWRANHTLHCWRFDGNLELLEHSVQGFYNMAREEFQETFSWRPLRINGTWYGITTDYCRVRQDRNPVEAMTFMWSFPASQFFEPGDMMLSIGEEGDGHGGQCEWAPRHMVQTGENTWEGLMVNGKHWQLASLVYSAH